MELAIHSEILTETYKELTNIYNSHDIKTAQGKELDQLLKPFIERHHRTYATVEICFKKDQNNNEEINIPSGTRITSSQYPEIIFHTLDDTIIPLETNQTLVDAICTNTGPEGNIPRGELNILITPIPGITQVYNPTNAIGGRNNEDDTSYRLRGQSWTSINSQGTLMAFKNAIKSVAGVEDYYIQRRWDGPGTTRIIINPSQNRVLKDVTYKGYNYKYCKTCSDNIRIEETRIRGINYRRRWKGVLLSDIGTGWLSNKPRTNSDDTNFNKEHSAIKREMKRLGLNRH